jgi:ribosome-binding factor A
MLEGENYKKEKVVEIISHAAAEFIQRESNRNSLITVTNVALSSDFQKSTIFVTIFPENQENAGLDFLQRNLTEFRDFVKQKTRLRNIPWFDFKLDDGEKSRQRIEKISQQL